MDYSKITEDLFIGTTPTVPDYKHLRELGVRLVINMRWEFHSLPASPLLPLVERFRGREQGDKAGQDHQSYVGQASPWREWRHFCSFLTPVGR